MYVCVCLFIYTTSISIICVPQEEPSLIASRTKTEKEGIYGGGGGGRGGQYRGDRLVPNIFELLLSILQFPMFLKKESAFERRYFERRII